jgi:branched-chain amino acid transport system substrate-binding protein
MKKMLMALMILFVFPMLFSPPLVGGAEELKVGILYPFSGTLALLGRDSFRGVEIATDMINEKGGIGGKKIVFVKGDSPNPKAAMEEAERLISMEKMKLIIGGYASSNAYAASQVTEKHKVIYWVTTAIADPITQRGFLYTFRAAARASQYGETAINFIKEVAAPKLGIEKTKLRIGIAHEDSLYGTTTGGAAKKKALEEGMNVVVSESYSGKTVDLSDLVMRLKAANPDVVIAAQYVPDGILLWRTFKELDFSPKVFLGCGSVHGMTTWGETFKEESTYVLSSVETPFINTQVLSPKAQALHKAFQERYTKKYGEHAAEIPYCAFKSVWVLYDDVLPRAGSLDPEAVRKAALQTNVPPTETVFGYGIKFAPPGHPDAGTNLEAKVWVEQWQMSPEGKPYTYVVWPEKMASRKSMIPMPNWDERKKIKK